MAEVKVSIKQGDTIKVVVRDHQKLDQMQFWNIITDSKGNGKFLEILDDDHLSEFYQMYNFLDDQAYMVLHDYWLQNWEISDDSFQYLIWWLIKEGWETYYKALGNPETIPVSEARDEAFRYGMIDVLEKNGIEW
jgi:hypothetical protein